ncbi:MAG: M14 family metallopeptidase, partial [Candidatus Neomarinimicrobiota bacterium]
MKSFARFLLGIFICSLPLLAQVRSPKDYFGHEMGADRQLISWDQIGEYFHYLDNRSDRVMVEELGRTTLDKPFLMVTITAAGDMTRLERLKVIQQRLGRADDLSPEEAAALIHEGKTVVLLTLNIHSTEIASTQESVELAWELATQEDERTRTILENVVLLIVPSLNPDGLEMVRNYYNKTLGTDSEGSSFPGLYHHYAGHDNNRDWFFFNLAESRLVARILYHEWYPEIIYDQHQMGNSSARLFMPPYQDPLNPNVHPRITAATNSLGKYVVAELIDQGFTGIVTGARFNAFYEGTMSKTPLWHNRIGILSEAASVRIATPTFHPKTSLRGMDHALNEYQAQTNFPLPWPGGWWRLRDLVEYEKAATYAILDLAATYKTRYKTNFYDLNREAIEKGRTEPPYAW